MRAICHEMMLPSLSQNEIGTSELDPFRSYILDPWWSFVGWKMLKGRVARPQWLIRPPIGQYIMRFSIGLVDR
jgi:hypothetical protein